MALMTDVEKEVQLGHTQITYEVIKTAYEYSWKNKCVLDEKVSKIIIYNATLSTLYIGLVGFIYRQINNMYVYTYINNHYILFLLFFVETIILLASLILGLYGFKLTDWSFPDPKTFEEYMRLADTDTRIALRDFTRDLAMAADENDKTSQERAWFIRKAYEFLVVGVILIIVCAICAVFFQLR